MFCEMFTGWVLYTMILCAALHKGEVSVSEECTSPFFKCTLQSTYNSDFPLYSKLVHLLYIYVCVVNVKYVVNWFQIEKKLFLNLESL